jgi:hypothetical protein
MSPRFPALLFVLMFLSTLILVSAATDRIPWLADLYRQTIWGTIFGPFFTPLVVGAVLLGVKSVLTRSFDRWYTAGYAGLAVAGAFAMRLAPSAAWDRLAGLLLR